MEKRYDQQVGIISEAIRDLIIHRPSLGGEQGGVMLSGVLNSERAIQVNIAIMRVFVKLRVALSASKELAQKLAQLEQKIEKHDEEITLIFDAIRELMAPPGKPRRKIGFKRKSGQTQPGE